MDYGIPPLDVVLSIKVARKPRGNWNATADKAGRQNRWSHSIDCPMSKYDHAVGQPVKFSVR